MTSRGACPFADCWIHTDGAYVFHSNGCFLSVASQALPLCTLPVCLLPTVGGALGALAGTWILFETVLKERCKPRMPSAQAHAIGHLGQGRIGRELLFGIRPH